MEEALPSQNLPVLFGNTAANASALDDIDALHAAHERRIFQFFLYNLRDRDAAYSLTQDTFVKVWRTRASFRGDCAPATWLMRIAHNLLLDHTRGGAFRFWRTADKHSVDASLLAHTLAGHDASAEQTMIAREQVQALWRVLDGLSERQRTVFTLRYLEDMPLHEIATVTGIPLPTVKTHLYRALDRVRAAMTSESQPTPSGRKAL